MLRVDVLSVVHSLTLSAASSVWMLVVGDENYSGICEAGNLDERHLCTVFSKLLALFHWFVKLNPTQHFASITGCAFYVIPVTVLETDDRSDTLMACAMRTHVC